MSKNGNLVPDVFAKLLQDRLRSSLTVGDCIKILGLPKLPPSPLAPEVAADDEAKP